jgi:NADH-quinone oxidoreductase subunit J
MDSINWHSALFYLFAAVTCGLAVAVVVSGNIVRMAAYLVAALGGVAGLFFLAGAAFLGSMQLMVYVGGTMVLLIFGVMLTARGPLVAMPGRGGQWIVAVIVGGSLLAVLLQAALSVESWLGPTSNEEQAVAQERAAGQSDATQLGLGFLGVRTEKLEERGDPALQRGMSGYLLPFEIVSVHLLVVLIGAAFLARARRRVGQSSTGQRGAQLPRVND